MKDYLSSKLENIKKYYEFNLNDYASFSGSPTENESFFSVLQRKEKFSLESNKSDYEDFRNQITSMKLQNETIKFCKDINYLQDKNTIHDLGLNDQLKFTGCVDEVIKALSMDFKQIEDNEELCFKNCKNEYQTYLNLKFENMKPNLDKLPCTKICSKIYKKVADSYEKYMTDNKGMYREFININKEI